jgi:hypothetical protein
MNEQSFRNMKIVHQDLLQSRIEVIKVLNETDLESYNIVKDMETGEHYIHYVYMHIELKGSGEKEYYHQFLPKDNDDVLGLLFNDQPYDYPTHWNHSFLRGGPQEGYVWFDPSMNGEFEQMEAVAKEIAERLKIFKEKGEFDQSSIKKLLDDVDHI